MRINSDTYNKIIVALKDDVKNNIITNIFENVTIKSRSLNEYETLQLLKNQLNTASEYLDSSNINEAVSVIDKDIKRISESNIDIPYNEKINSFNLKGKVIALKEDKAYQLPVVKELINVFESEYSYYSDLDLFNVALHYLSNVNESESVVNLVSGIKSYIDDNKKMLLAHATVNTLGKVGGMYDDDLNKIKSMVVNESLSSSRLETSLSKVTLSNPFVSEMIKEMKGVEGVDSDFNLGKGDLNLIVENYIGPAYKYDNGIILHINNSFIDVTKNKVNENDDAVSNILGRSGEYTIYEASVPYVHTKYNEFYRLVESFNGVGFKYGNKGIYSNLKDLPVDIKINESNNMLDLYIDNRIVESVSDVAFDEMFSLESSNKKNAAVNVLNNVDKIYNIGFVKTVINESRVDNILNIGNDYYVFDKSLNESKFSVYKMNGVQLYKHLRNNFGYDARRAFELSINETENKINELVKERNKLRTYIDDLEKLHEGFVSALGDVNDDEIAQDIQKFDDDVVNAMDYMKNEYVKTGDDIEQLNAEPEMLNKYFGVGDRVNIQPDGIEGNVVSHNNTQNKYSVACDDGNVMEVDGDKLLLIQVKLIDVDDENDIDQLEIEDVQPVETPEETSAQVPENTEIAANTVDGITGEESEIRNLNDDDNDTVEFPLKESDGDVEEVNQAQEDVQGDATNIEKETGDNEQTEESGLSIYKFIIDADDNIKIEDGDGSTTELSIGANADDSTGMIYGEVSAKNEEDAKKLISLFYIQHKDINDIESYKQDLNSIMDENGNFTTDYDNLISVADKYVGDSEYSTETEESTSEETEEAQTGETTEETTETTTDDTTETGGDMTTEETEETEETQETPTEETTEENAETQETPTEETTEETTETTTESNDEKEGDVNESSDNWANIMNIQDPNERLNAMETELSKVESVDDGKMSEYIDRLKDAITKLKSGTINESVTYDVSMYM